MNAFSLVGKAARLPQLRESDQGWKSASVFMDVERPFANAKGTFESDRIEVVVYRGAAETLVHCVKEGDWLCIRGRIQSRPCEKDGHTWLNYMFIAEKIEYLS